MYAKESSHGKNRVIRILLIFLVSLGVIGAGFAGYKLFIESEPTIEEKIVNELLFDASVASDEAELVRTTLANNATELDQSVQAQVATMLESTDLDSLVGVYVPVVDFNSVRQSVTSAELTELSVSMLDTTDPVVVAAAAEVLGTSIETIAAEAGSIVVPEGSVAFIPVSLLDDSLKLLEFDGGFYLDSLTSGALFRSIEFDSPAVFTGVSYLELPTDESVYTVNMTGVTALTRVMQRKLATVGDPLYFSAKIGDFLADADLTHVSNEVSFQEGCIYSNTSFCSPPEFIETLKASGVDLVELTGNHNNDRGGDLNTATIELYRSLGWGTVGGGLNATDAAQPFVVDEKDSNIAFLAYNFPDSPNGGAIASESRAGANAFDFSRIETEIAAAKETADFVIVNVQYWECYSYPNGYIEYPVCDKPIGKQEADFKKLIDLGADMVVGSSAHQPQTYELYKGKPIYYGLGNLYFDQTSWPGTERGIVLTHYFSEGQLLQTKLTPTVFDRELQTRLMTDSEAAYLLQRLADAR